MEELPDTYKPVSTGVIILINIFFQIYKNKYNLLKTTIMAIIYDGGVLLGADSRTSTVYNFILFKITVNLLNLIILKGNYVFNRATDKIEYIHDRIYALGAGNAADIRFISKIVRYYL